MKVIHLISGGDSGGAKTHVLSLLRHLNETITAQLVCFRDGPFAQEARAMGIPTEIMNLSGVMRVGMDIDILRLQLGIQNNLTGVQAVVSGQHEPDEDQRV